MAAQLIHSNPEKSDPILIRLLGGMVTAATPPPPTQPKYYNIIRL